MNIVIYGKKDCSFCSAAIDLLAEYQWGYEYYDVESDDFDINNLLERTNGNRKVPAIFIDDQYIGGYAELRKTVLENHLGHDINKEQYYGSN